MKIKKGDNVIITAGKDKGKKGAVLKVIPKENRLIVEGLNIRKRHESSRKSGTKKGQIVEVAVPMDASNVMVVDAKTGKPSRVGRRMEGGKKVRFAKKSGAILA